MSQSQDTLAPSVVNTMLTELKLRLEDPTQSEFSEELKLQALNNAQDSVVNLINDAYLTELEVKEEWDVLANQDNIATFGVFPLSKLTNTVRGGSAGIKAVRVNGSSKFATRMEIEEVKLIDNTMIDVASDEPYYIVFGGTIELYPKTTQIAIKLDVFYIKNPSALVKNGSTDLNVLLHPILISLAESNCWVNSEDLTRSASAKEIGMNEILVLNQRYQESE